MKHEDVASLSTEDHERRMWIRALVVAAFLLGLAWAAPFTSMVPSSIQTNVNIATLTGWTLCYNITYSQSGLSVDGAEFGARCAGSKLLIGCRLTGSSNILALAGGYRNDTQGAAAPPTGTVAAGTTTRFYKSSNATWGFTNESLGAPAACISASGPSDVGWELSGDSVLQAGGMCAGVYLPFSSAYEKVVFSSACDGKNAGDPCTSREGACCYASTCAGGSGECLCTNATTAVPLGQCESSRTCDAVTGDFTTTYRSAAFPCEAGNRCLLGDHCTGVNDTCVEGITPKPVPPPPTCHNPGVCIPSFGNFSYSNNGTDGSPCLISLCIIGSTCAAGQCQGGVPRVCLPLDDCHVAGECSNSTGLCSNPLATAGTPCDFGLSPCELEGECLANGTCQATVGVDCSTPVGCYGPGTCSPNNGSCIGRPFLPVNTSCDDSNGCTPSSVCDGAGTCVPGPEIECTALDACHRPGTCVSFNSSYGECTNPARLDGFTCVPDACTVGATCIGGNCTGGSTITCPGDQCNFPLLFCNPVTGCDNPKLNGTACDDGNDCTDGDQCWGGLCFPGVTNTSLPGCPASIIEWMFA